MMRLLVIACIVLIVTSCQNAGEKGAGKRDSTAASSIVEKNIYKSGDSMLAAFRRKDWTQFVKYNHPNMVQRMGGVPAFASFVKLQMKQIPADAIKSISLGRVLQVVKTPEDQQCVVEQRMELQSGGTTINKKTLLVGESLDDGKTWTFFDVSTKQSLSPKDIKPNLSPDLNLTAIP